MCHYICYFMSCWFPYCLIACKALPGPADQWLPDDDDSFHKWSHDGDGAGLSDQLSHGQADRPQQHQTLLSDHLQDNNEAYVFQ